MRRIDCFLKNYIKLYKHTLFRAVMDFLIESSTNYTRNRRTRPIQVPLIPALLESQNYTYFYRNKNAITSYGFILLKLCKEEGKVKVLLVRRQYSVSFTTFIIGRYSINDVRYLNSLFRTMTNEEKKLIQTESFHSLWDRIWFRPETKSCLVRKFEVSYEKYIAIKNGVYNDDNMFVKLSNLIKYNRSVWLEPDWGLPKGRKEKKELALTCATRELNEETGLTKQDFTHLDKIYPLYEKFTGTDNLLYKHVYYVGILKPDVEPQLDKNNRQQMAEIGDIGLFAIEDAMKLMRSNKKRKIKMFEKLKEIIDLKYPKLLDGMTYRYAP